MIKKLGDKKWRIDFQPSRHAPRIRRTIVGPRALAQEVLLELRKRSIASTFGWPDLSTATIQDLCQLVMTDYQINKRKSLHSAKQLRDFWVKLCGRQPAEQVTGRDLNDYAEEWIAGGLSPARANRRMAFLLRAYRLGLESDPPLIHKIPRWRRLREAPPRSGTFSWDTFVKVRDALPEHAKIPATICYWTGMRSGEVFGLEWAQVQFSHHMKLVTIQLHGDDTKTSEPRKVVMGGDLYATLNAWRDETHQCFPSCQQVCHWKGTPLRSIKSAWRTACVRAGLGTWGNPDGRYIGNRHYRGPLLHDFRRTAVSQMEDSGVPRKVAMSISGHKTDSIYRRYHIVSDVDLIEAGKRVVARHKEKQQNPT